MRLFEQETRELNACHQGPADLLDDRIRELEREHFRRCYDGPPK